MMSEQIRQRRGGGRDDEEEVKLFLFSLLALGSDVVAAPSFAMKG